MQRLIWREWTNRFVGLSNKGPRPFFFPTRVLELFFFFAPPNRWPTSKKSDHKWRIDGTTSGLINSVTALHGAYLSDRRSVTFQKERINKTKQFPRSLCTIEVHFFLFRVFNLKFGIIVTVFFFLQNFVKEVLLERYIYIYVRNNYQQRLQRKCSVKASLSTAGKAFTNL